MPRFVCAKAPSVSCCSINPLDRMKTSASGLSGCLILPRSLSHANQSASLSFIQLQQIFIHKKLPQFISHSESFSTLKKHLKWKMRVRLVNKIYVLHISTKQHKNIRDKGRRVTTVQSQSFRIQVHPTKSHKSPKFLSQIFRASNNRVKLSRLSRAYADR